MTITDRFQQGQQMFAPLFKRMAEQRANEIAFELLQRGDLRGDPDPNVQHSIRQQLATELALDDHLAQRDIRASDASARLATAMSRMSGGTSGAMWDPGAPIDNGDGTVSYRTGPRSVAVRRKDFTGPTDEQAALDEALGKQRIAVNGREVLVGLPKLDIPKAEKPFWEAFDSEPNKPTPEAIDARQKEIAELPDYEAPAYKAGSKYAGETYGTERKRLAYWSDYVKGNTPPARAKTPKRTEASFWEAMAEFQGDKQPESEPLGVLPALDEAAKAEAWARANPTDPRAIRILKAHGR